MKTKFSYLIGIVTVAIGAVWLLLATLSASAATLSAPASVTWTDDFNSPALDSHWAWIREDAAHWSLTARPGFLRIIIQPGTLISNPKTSKNLLLQSAPGGDFEIQTRLIFTPTQNFQFAGLLIHQDDDNVLRLGRAFCDLAVFCVGNAIYFVQEKQGHFFGSFFGITTTDPGSAYLRLIRHGLVFTGYEGSNGISWTLVGTHTVDAPAPLQIGLMGDSLNTGAAEIPADFDFFTLIDSSFRLFLPLVRR